MPLNHMKEELRRLILELSFSDLERDLYLRGIEGLSDAEAREALSDLNSSLGDAEPALELAREVLRKRQEKQDPKS